MRGALILELTFGLGLAASAACSPKASATVELEVFAASSLTEAFTELETAFERAHPEVDLKLQFGGSQVLRIQIEQGAGADVFASANAAHLRALADAGLASPSVALAANELVVIVPLDNPAGLDDFASLTRAERLVVGTPEVPVGAYTQALLEAAAAAPELGPDFRAQVEAQIVSRETNVRLVRAKVELGEADAAIVYRSDALASEQVRVIPIPASLAVPIESRLATMTKTDQPELAAAFVAFARSEAGAKILARHGLTPTPTEAPKP